MLQPSPGQWYISLVCECCKHRVFLFRDLTEGESNLERSRVSATCPECGQMTSSQIEHYLQPRKIPSGELTAPQL